MKIVGLVISCTSGRDAAFDSSRVRLAFCAAERLVCMGWRVFAFRYAVAKLEREDGVCERFWIRLKLGKRSAVVVLGVELLGREEAVMRMFVKGYIESRCTFSYYTF